MKYLLDTNVFLWALAEEHKLNPTAIKILKSSSSELHLSSASTWEIAIKYALGTLPLPKPPAEYVMAALRSSGLTAMDITHEHALRAGPLPPHHRDPFDRLLIAQALTENMTILTGDRIFQNYKVNSVLCGK